MIHDTAPRVKREAPPRDDFIRIAELDMSESEFKLRYPHVIMYGSPDDPYVSLAELGEGDDA